ncbi:MAG: hypothetical protein ACE5DT_04120 [Nitrosopumilus sp.]
MPAKGPVSLTWQTIFCFIPIMDIVASYRVKRLRWYLAIFLSFGAVSSVIQMIVYPFEEASVYNEKVYSEINGFDWNYAILGNNPELGIASIIVHNAIAYTIAVYLIRRWSKNWNLQFT